MRKAGYIGIGIATVLVLAAAIYTIVKYFVTD